MTPAPSTSRMCRIALVALLAFSCVASADPALPSAIVDDDIGVLHLFDEFVSSGAAASRCATPDNQDAARFLSNFQWVSIYATIEIRRQQPDAPPTDASAELVRRSKEIKERTHALVKAEGCESESVQELVRKFAIQAAWQRQG